MTHSRLSSSRTTAKKALASATISIEKSYEWTGEFSIVLEPAPSLGSLGLLQEQMLYKISHTKIGGFV